MQTQIPIWEKFILTVEEASNYFGIGQNRLRNIARENPNSDFVVWIGSKLCIKRVKFEEFINITNAI